MAMLKNCCTCLSLKTGTLIIGTFSLVSLSVINPILRLTKADFKAIENNKILSSIHLFSNEFLLIIDVSFFVLAVTSIFLMIGASKGLKFFLLPWIISFFFFINLYTAFLIFVMVRLSGLILGGIMFILAVFFLCALAFQVYLLMVVVSLFKELHKSTQPEPGPNTDGKIYSGPNYWSSSAGVFVVSYTLGNEAA